ncbi:MAG: hypothetical protein AB1776_08045 [Bacillota bacterium]
MPLAVVEKILTPGGMRPRDKAESEGYCPFCASPLEPGESICPDCLLDVALQAALEE